jgi:adenylate kinase
VRNRLSAYHEQTAPLAEWYQDRGLLFRIDGDRTIEEVGDAIGNAIASMGSRDV